MQLVSIPDECVSKLTIGGGDIISIGTLVRCALQKWHAQDLHDPVQQTVRNLKPSFSVHINRTKSPIIPRLPLDGQILYRDIGHLEDLHREGKRAILSSGFEHARKK